MKRPSWEVRFAGSRQGACLILLACVLVVFAWDEGALPWWVALAAAGAALRTLGALGRMRRYNAWAAQWQAMGEEEEEAPPRRVSAGDIPQGGGMPARSGGMKTGRRKVGRLLTWVSALCLTLPVWMGLFGARGPVPDGIAALWGASLVFLLCRMLMWALRRVFRRGARQVGARQPDAEAEGGVSGQVAWLLGPASSSPSRADAERQLPEYCAALLRR